MGGADKPGFAVGAIGVFFFPAGFESDKFSIRLLQGDLIFQADGGFDPRQLSVGPIAVPLLVGSIVSEADAAPGAGIRGNSYPQRGAVAGPGGEHHLDGNLLLFAVGCLLRDDDLVKVTAVEQ